MEVSKLLMPSGMAFVLLISKMQQAQQEFMDYLNIKEKENNQKAYLIMTNQLKT